MGNGEKLSKFPIKYIVRLRIHIFSLISGGAKIKKTKKHHTTCKQQNIFCNQNYWVTTQNWQIYSRRMWKNEYVWICDVKLSIDSWCVRTRFSFLSFVFSLFLSLSRDECWKHLTLPFQLFLYIYKYINTIQRQHCSPMCLCVCISLFTN